MADGSVIIEANIDVSKADKELANLKKEIQKTESSIGKQETKKAPLVARAEEMAQKMKEARAEVERYKQEWSSGVIGADRSQSAVQERLSAMEAEYAKVVEQIDKIDNKLAPAYEKLDAMKVSAGELQQNINNAANSTSKLKTAAATAEKHMDKFTKRLAGLAKRVFVFTIITSALRSLKDWLWETIKTNDEAVSAVSKLKAALLTLAQPLVNFVIPVFTSLVNVLTNIVIAISQVMSMLFGTTAEESAKAAEKLYDEQNAIEGVGAAAKEATKQLASFDEINRITSDSSSSASQSILPDFSSLNFGTIPEWLSSITLTMHDILFTWKNLTAKDVLKKVVASLMTLAGTVIGFSLGGFGGSIIGMTIGAAVGALISGLTFDNKKSLSTEEILKSLCLALTAITGAIIGFKVGGVKGSAIGITVGAAAALAINSLLFDGNGALNTEEVLKSLCAALFAIAGTILGFSVGGADGAVIGVLVSVGVTAGVISLLFNNDGIVSTEELLKSVCTALFSLTGGVLGFFVGGAKGAAIGVLVGASFGALVSSLLFDNNGTVSTEEVIRSVCTALGALVGGVIGFSVGGPGGAVVGVMIGAGATAALSNLVFDNNGVVSAKELLTGLCGVLGALVGGIIGFSVGGPVGAVIGMVIGATVTIKLTDVLFEGFNTLKQKVPGFTGIGPDYSWLFKSVDVPGLATGSVVPPNREFLAVLGDNKTETEVVSPLSTIKQALMEALQESGGTSGNVTITVKPAAGLTRYLKYELDSESARQGSSLVTVGGVTR